jgi:hypothetical protein
VAGFQISIQARDKEGHVSTYNILTARDKEGHVSTYNILMRCFIFPGQPWLALSLRGQLLLVYVKTWTFVKPYVLTRKI